MAKILFFDIETTPNVSYTWGKYEQNVLAFVQESELLCFAYKWQGKPTKIETVENQTERQLAQKLWRLFDEADIIIGHNGDAFDIKYSNGRFLYHGFQPPLPYKTVDTLKIARQMFKLNSNKLDDLGEKLGLGRKVQTGGFSLWLGCMANKPSSWRKMRRYNKQDVDLLEQVYDRLKGWKKSHPNLNYIDEIERPACATCGSEQVISKGVDRTLKTPRQRWKCKSCGANQYALKDNPLRT
ncbi:ribonuclease H-like domain-containing protein [Paracoccaceae bacterium GXU_MW_L88]